MGTDPRDSGIPLLRTGMGSWGGAFLRSRVGADAGTGTGGGGGFDLPSGEHIISYSSVPENKSF